MPIVWTEKIDQHGELAIWHITENAEDLYAKLQLNADEKKYYESLQNGKRNMHWLGSRVLLRTLLKTNHYIDVQLDENNKPYLVNFPFEFSISHSNDYASVIIYKGKKVGIDIEKMSEKILRIQKKFMSETELSFISEQDKIEQLYVCWGIKESLFKLYGKGNLPFIEGIQIEPFNYHNDIIIKASIHKNNFHQSFNMRFKKHEDYMLVWCVE